MNSPLRMIPRITKGVRSFPPTLWASSKSQSQRAPSVHFTRRFSNTSHTFRPAADDKSPNGNSSKPSSLATSGKGRLPEFRMDEKVVIITGGVGGVGMHMAEALLEAGAHVYAVDRVPEDKLPKEFYDVRERGKKEFDRTFGYRAMDVTSSKEVHNTIEEITNQHGRLDGLIAAAGINIEKTALDHTTEDIDKILSINVTGCFLSAQAAAKQMIKKGTPGSIALIASMSGTIANKDLICPAYNASKAAVVQLTRNLAMEWGPHKIRVNSISPGYILTPMVHVLLKDHPHRKVNWPKDNMLGRLSQPEEYRGAAVFLLSDASSFMTGTDLLIDGGHHAW